MQSKKTNTAQGENVLAGEQMESKNDKHLEIFPMPTTTNEFSIRSSKNMEEIVVYNLEGKAMFSLKVGSVKNSKLSLSKEYEGIYYIHCRFEDGTSEVRSVIRK